MQKCLRFWSNFDTLYSTSAAYVLQEYKNSVRTYPFSRGYKLILLAQFAIIMLFLKSDRSDDKPGNNKWTECMRWILNVA